MKRITWIALGAVALAALWMAHSATAQSFEGKTITIIVGYKPGGGYDSIARLLAHHLPKHIPGRPTVVADPASAISRIFHVIARRAAGRLAASALQGAVTMPAISIEDE